MYVGGVKEAKLNLVTTCTPEEARPVSSLSHYNNDAHTTDTQHTHAHTYSMFSSSLASDGGTSHQWKDLAKVQL